jgi:hypothetical protein
MREELFFVLKLREEKLNFALIKGDKNGFFPPANELGLSKGPHSPHITGAQKYCRGKKPIIVYVFSPL